MDRRAILCQMQALHTTRRAAIATALAAACLPTAPAGADVFDGRIAFSSFRVDPPAGMQRSGDIFSMSPDGSGLRRLTTNPENDRQADWSPGGTAIAYSIRKPDSPINFEVARMTAAGTGQRRLTTTSDPQASSQPSWFPNSRGLLFRRSGPGLESSVWQMGTAGQNPRLRYQPPTPVLYPSFSPDMKKIVFTGVVSPEGDTDRAIFTVDADGGGLTTVFDVPGAYDSAPAWSPDGRHIAFESNANIDGANPEGDLEIWTMDADGSDVRQLTHNALHDEGPAWSPDRGRKIAYTSGPDNLNGDINLMTATGRQLAVLQPHEGRDESPDWQAIPAPKTARRCGGVSSQDVRDVRARGIGMICLRARSLARRWTKAGRPGEISGFAVRTKDFGGTTRVVMSGRSILGTRQLVAFLDESG